VGSAVTRIGESLAPKLARDDAVLDEVRGLMDRVFDDFSDDDWQHTLGDDW
jgi:hypothetical protein